MSSNSPSHEVNTMTNKLAPLALTLGAALLLAGQAKAESPYDLRYIGREVAKVYCSDEVQSQLIGASAFTRGQVANFLREELGADLAFELSAAEKGKVSAIVRELTLGGYCEPGSI
jgi:hypothetical protein